MNTIAASNGVKKVGQKEGRTIQVGDARLTWKATGADTGYTTSLYEMDLAPGSGCSLQQIGDSNDPNCVTTCDQRQESSNERTHTVELSSSANLRAGKLSAATSERRASSQAISSFRSPVETPNLLHAQTSEAKGNAPDIKGSCNGSIAYRRSYYSQQQVVFVWAGIIAIVVISVLAVWGLWLKASGAVIELGIPCS